MSIGCLLSFCQQFAFILCRLAMLTEHKPNADTIDCCHFLLESADSLLYDCRHFIIWVYIVSVFFHCSLSLSLYLYLSVYYKKIFFLNRNFRILKFLPISSCQKCAGQSFVSVMKLTACEKITKRTRDESSPNRGSKWPWKRLDTPTNRWGSISIILFTSYFLSISTEKLDKNYIFFIVLEFIINITLNIIALATNLILKMMRKDII